MSIDRLVDGIDLAALPDDLVGKWVFLRIERGRQEILSSGEDILEVVKGQPQGPQYLLTRVPQRSIVHVTHAKP